MDLKEGVILFGDNSKENAFFKTFILNKNSALDSDSIKLVV